jgi:hypothetical protein
MIEGKPVSGDEFFGLLCRSDEFCASLGRVMLAACQLESQLKQFLATQIPSVNTSRATLGRLISYCKDHSCLMPMLPALEVVKDQRNYLTHNIHALLFGLIEETVLEGSGLIDSDVITYTERAWQLRENLDGLSAIIESKIA